MMKDTLSPELESQTTASESCEQQQADPQPSPQDISNSSWRKLLIVVVVAVSVLAGVSIYGLWWYNTVYVPSDLDYPRAFEMLLLNKGNFCQNERRVLKVMNQVSQKKKATENRRTRLVNAIKENQLDDIRTIFSAADKKDFSSVEEQKLLMAYASSLKRDSILDFLVEVYPVEIDADVLKCIKAGILRIPDDPKFTILEMALLRKAFGTVKRLLQMTPIPFNLKHQEQKLIPFCFYLDNAMRTKRLDLETVELFINHGAEIVRGSPNYTPLHHAVINGSLELIDYLLEKHPEMILKKDHFDIEPVHKLLISSLLSEAAVLKKFAQVNPECLKTVTLRGSTIFHRLVYASRQFSKEDFAECVRFLVEDGKVISINAKDSDQETPLDTAIRLKIPDEMIDSLKKHGAL